ncbi:hypothetical protein BDF21DRAFT_427569 [Thamnidium elegans]|nr:hypothetical protein BDF21DRAFT_427569 [Thamnidium elegans]
MIKHNIVIYPLPYITKEKLAPFSPKLNKLETQTNTVISFDYVEQYFNIEGETQEECDKAEETIIYSLLPIFNKMIDKSCMIGTFEDISYFEEMAPPVSLDLVNVVGRPLGVDPLELEEEKCIAEPPKLDEEQFLIKEFHISQMITKPFDLLIGPPQFNMQLTEYMDIIPTLTNTACTLKDRCIVITGEESCVNDAFSRFNVIQKSFIAHLNTLTSLCIHNPNSTGYYDLCFCELDSYYHRSYVQEQILPKQKLLNIHIMLPVFLNPLTKEYEKPKDYIQTNAPRQREPYSTMKQQDYERKKTKSKELNDAFSSCNIKSPDRSLCAATSRRSTPTPTMKVERSTERLPANGFQHVAPEHVVPDYEASGGDVESVSSAPSVYQYEVIQVPEKNIQNFPTLPSSPSSQKNARSSGRRSNKTYSPMISNEKTRVNRVIKIMPLKSSQGTLSLPSTPSIPLVERVKQLNYYTIKNSLRDGLNALRGFKGEINLSAKIGRVLWTNISPETKSQVWKFEDINDVIVKELGVNHVFSDITTTNTSMFERITSENIFPYRPYNKTSIYEFYCSARNQKSLPHRDVVIHMNHKTIVVRKVVLREKKTTAINWVSLDRKFDFQLSISTRVLTRRDVKPYTTFIKKISICPISLLMTFEEIPNFLRVKYILLKDTARYKIIYPFIVEVTQVENVPFTLVPNSSKLKASPGTGNVWYDFEIRNTENDKSFEVNKALEIGKEANWTADEILKLTEGDCNTADTITQYVTTLLLFIEKIEREIT